MKYKLLIADDEKPVHDLLKRTFDAERYELLDVFDGARVKDTAIRRRPDLILLDLHMPDRDGRVVLLDLRNDPRTRAIPVLILTGDHGDMIEAEGLDLGADDFVHKPFNPAVLKARVEGALRRNAGLAAHPLTQLPGGAAIEHELRRRLGASEPFGLVYLDIDHFQEFNDSHGHERGDAVLQALADVLHEASDAAKAGGFIGHIGEDDFLLLTRPEASERLVQDIVARFKARSPTVTLSIVITSTQDHDFGHKAKLMQLVKEFKDFLKNRKDRGESVYIKHRSRPKRR